MKNENSTYHGMSLFESGAKEAEGKRGRKKEYRDDFILISLVGA